MNRPWPSFFAEASRGAGPGVNGPASRSSSTPTPFSGTTSLSPLLLPPPPPEPHSLGPGFGQNESIGRGSTEVIPVARAPPPSPRESGQERQQPANRPESEGTPKWGVGKRGRIGWEPSELVADPRCTKRVSGPSSRQDQTNSTCCLWQRARETKAVERAGI